MVAQTVGARTNGPSVDVNALKTNQTLIVVLTVIAFVLGAGIGAWIVLFVGVSLGIGAAFPGYGPFQLLYKRVLKPYRVVKPRPRRDDPAPHRFAQAMGSVFLIAGAVALFFDASTVGWVLAWIVIALALVNLVFGFCAGCFAFFHIRRLLANGGATS